MSYQEAADQATSAREDCPDGQFTDRLSRGCPQRASEDLDALGSEDCVEATGVDAAPAPALTAVWDRLPPQASPPRNPEPMLANPRAIISWLESSR
jgi:hypothetical protein